MLSSIKQRIDREDEGFTLIELMVVVLIIAILLAIAIPTFLSARNGANARASQSNLRNALTAEQTQWTNNQSFADAAGLTAVESSVQWVSTAPASGNIVGVAVGDLDSSNNAQAVALNATGKDGNCYTVLVSNDPTNSFTGYNVTKGACPAPAVPSPLPTVSTTGKATGGSSTTYYMSW